MNLNDALCIALATGIFVYFNNYYNERRKAKLERINRQLGEFYGPLYSLLKSDQAAWKAFCEKYRIKDFVFDPKCPPPEEILIAWRLFMDMIFGPSHEKMYDVIISKSDLLIEDNMPACLLRLISHIAVYKTVREKWKNGDFSEHTSIIDFPTDVDEYIVNSFERLKREQYFMLHAHIYRFVFLWKKL